LPALASDMKKSTGVRELIIKALDEDIGPGDVTAQSVLAGNEKGNARAVAKSALVVAGLEVFSEVFDYVEGPIEVNALCNDGDCIGPGDVIARISGNLKGILMAERVALNFIQRMSGIATLTSAFVDKVAGTGVRILDTRKTTPGLRILEKYAVKIGGGVNHRFGLYGGAMIKENHIAAAGGISEAVTRVKNQIPPTLKIEVEVKNLSEVKEALCAGVDIVMLDNMDVAEMIEAVQVIGTQALVEASGNVSLDNVREIAETGVDFISVGSLTHSAPAADISLLVDV